MDKLRNLELADYIGIFGVAGMVLGIITLLFNLPLEFLFTGLLVMVIALAICFRFFFV